ncbi:MAG: hypothetical protein PF689_13780 [Deltaproteobacteria bacterium]|jgi:hypothetical protein|nr:hypothetical protein [Deltaproteobacteria bacterium]
MNMLKKISLSEIVVFLLVLLPGGALGYFYYSKYEQAGRLSEVPHYLKNIHQSATVFADRNLKYNLKHENKRPLFPQSSPLTPSVKCCTRKGQSQKCIPNGKGYTAYSLLEWHDESWKQLGIKIVDPHLFRYRFVKTTIQGKPGFKALAQGDLDCDGVSSQYYRTGHKQGNRIVGSGEIFSEKPGE